MSLNDNSYISWLGLKNVLVFITLIICLPIVGISLSVYYTIDTGNLLYLTAIFSGFIPAVLFDGYEKISHILVCMRLERSSALRKNGEVL